MARLPQSSNKHVLIIGGGLAGLSAIHALRQKDKEVKITLVNAKDYCEILWASYRSPFDEGTAKDSLIRLPKYCASQNVTFVQATVTSVTKNSCQATLLESGESTSMAFDVCVLATGANADWNGLGRDLPTTLEASKAEARLQALKTEGERLMNASSVVIVGGGFIGCELAGDLAAYSQKAGKSPTITVVHAGEHLCNQNVSAAAGKALKSMLEGFGVKVVLNEKATESAGKVTLSTSKEVIDAEVVIKTIGFIPVNAFVKAGLPEALDEKGWLKTDKFGVVPGSDGKVFAFGDCSPLLPNSGSNYMQLGAVLGHNMQVTLTESSQPMKEITVASSHCIVTVGPQKGVYQIGPMWGRHFLPWIKNKTMFFMSARMLLSVKDEFKLSKA
jgi:NADH dehydrogenase